MPSKKFVGKCKNTHTKKTTTKSPLKSGGVRSRVRGQGDPVQPVPDRWTPDLYGNCCRDGSLPPTSACPQVRSPSAYRQPCD